MNFSSDAAFWFFHASFHMSLFLAGLWSAGHSMRLPGINIYEIKALSCKTNRVVVCANLHILLNGLLIYDARAFYLEIFRAEFLPPPRASVHPPINHTPHNARLRFSVKSCKFALHLQKHTRTRGRVLNTALFDEEYYRDFDAWRHLKAIFRFSIIIRVFTQKLNTFSSKSWKCAEFRSKIITTREEK